MGERKGTNKYYPPDFNPQRHRNLNAYHGTHALRERGRKAGEGILTIRFEMPFNCWCLTCKNPIGMGVRYNAEKKKVGMYHSTPIFQFSMPCHLCAGTIVMQTDPQNFDYVILEGARRKHQKWDPEENEQIVIANTEEKKKLFLDAMYHLEHDVQDKVKASEVGPVIEQLEVDRQSLKDDFTLNQMARKHFREAKYLALEKDNQDRRMMDRLSLTGSDVQLLPEEVGDATAAKLMRLSHTQRNCVTANKNRLPVDKDILFPHKTLTSPNNRMNTPDSSSTSSSTSSEKRALHIGHSFEVIPYCSEMTKRRSAAFNVSTSFDRDKPKHIPGVRLNKPPVSGRHSLPDNPTNLASLVGYDASDDDE